MSSTRVLLIDDDKDFLESFKRLLESSFGLEDVEACASEKEAISKIENSISGYSHIFVDCVLAGSDGVGLSKTLSTLNKPKNPDSKTFLVSGFVDVSMLPDDLSHITSSLKKPLNTDVLSQIFERQSVIKKLDIFSKYNGVEELTANFNDKKIGSAIEFIPVLSQLIHFEFSGKIVFMNKEGNSSVIFMAKGEFDHITDSVIEPFGGYLERYGFINKTDLDSALDSEAFKNSELRIGNFLIKENIISPHAVDSIIRMQTINRFKKIISYTDFTVNFVFEDIKSKNATLIYADYYDCLKESLKFEDQVIYKLSEKVLVQTTELYPTSKFSMLNGNIDQSLKGVSNKEKFLLILSGAATLIEQDSKGDSVSMSDFEFSKRILSIENPYEVLGLNPENLTDTTVAKTYHKIAKRIHPDKLEALNLSAEEEEIIHKGFAKLTSDFNKIKTADKRQNFETRKLLSDEKDKTRISLLTEECTALLHKGQISQAREINKEIQSLKGHAENEQAVLIDLWVRLKSNQKIDIEKAKDYLDSGSEKTVIETYLFALLQKASGDNKMFIQHLQQATNIDASFLPARREFIRYKSELKNAKAPKKSTSAFGNLFSYKKSS